jgi:uncharacterized protein (DUF2141 family)
MKKIFDFKKIVLLVLIQIVCGIFLFAEETAEEKKLTVQITNVTSEEGQIILAIYNSSENYDKRIAFQEVKLKPEIDTVIFETNVPDGEYLVMLVHDINNNGKLDTSFIGMPKEPVGLSNYDGKGIPGKFKKHKFSVNENTSVISTVG